MDAMKKELVAFAICVVAGAVMASGKDEGAFIVLPGESYVMKIDSDVKSRVVEACVAVKGNRNASGLGNVSWCLTWAGADGRPLRMLEVRWGNECLGDPLDRRFMQVSVDSLRDDGSVVPLLKERLFEGVALYGGHNTIAVEEKSGRMDIWIGNELERHVGCCRSVGGACEVALEGSRTLDVRYAAYAAEKTHAGQLGKRWILQEAEEYLETHVSDVEGIWDFLDRDNNARLAKPGGKYRLALVKFDVSRDGGILDVAPEFFGRIPVYEILYLDGAQVNADEWNAGMTKGFLYSTIFENHFDLLWFDSYMEPMAGEQWADMQPGAVISLNFPLLRSQMRFSKARVR